MSADDPDLQLLLTDAESRLPILDSGLPDAALAEAPAPETGPRGKDSMELEAPDRDPNDLPAQRWGVIAPRGDHGDRMIEAIRELIAHRHAQQGDEPMIFRVDPDMDAGAAIRWRNEVHRAERLPEDERPRYLLILGDLDEVSLELQHVLQNGALVGRLHCPTIQGFRAYAEKVVSREKGEEADRGRSLFYTVQDGSAAIQAGYGRLVEPCMTMTNEWSAKGKLDLTAVTEIPYSDWSPDDLLDQAGADTPSVMLSLSHGLGAPRKGWRSPEQQRALQGALSMGLESPLTADDLRETPFLPGGVWMCIACFAAGTPKASAYASWLELLAENGGDPRAVRAVLRSLPRAGERPFVAALPQALLANPSGPLAVIGHMDLAWTFAFTDPQTRRSRASRLFSTYRALLAGSRVGVGLDALMSVYRETNDDLTSRYQTQRDALTRGQPDPIAPRDLSNLWMQRNDLRGYVLLGDPAARLPVRSDSAALQSWPGKKPRWERPEELGKDARGPSVNTEESSPTQVSEMTNNSATEEPEPFVPLKPPLSPPPKSPVPINDAPARAPESAGASTTPRAPSTPESGGSPAPPWPGAGHVGPTVTAPTTWPSGQQELPARPPWSPPPPPPSSYAHSEAPMTVNPAPPAPAAPYGAAPAAAVVRPRTLENPEIGLRERAVLAMIRGDEAPRSIAVRFGLPLEEIFYWLDLYREAGRRALAG